LAFAGADYSAVECKLVDKGSYEKLVSGKINNMPMASLRKDCGVAVRIGTLLKLKKPQAGLPVPHYAGAANPRGE
jgi:hypothetical protein